MIRENTNVWLWYIHTFLFNAFCQWNNLYLPFLTWILWWKTRAVCSGSCTLQDWNTEISAIPSGILRRIKLNFEVLFIFASLSKCMVRAGESLYGGQSFSQDSYRDQRDVLVEFELLHFSHCSNEDYTEMTTSCQRPTDKWAHEFQSSMYHWSLFGDVIEVFLK